MDESILAVDPTSRGIAFAFFDQGRPRCWGERLRSDLRSIEELVQIFRPSVLVIEDVHAERCRRRPRVRKLLGAIARHAERCGSRLVAVPRDDVRKAWSARGIRTKIAMSAAVAQLFEELAPVVPPRRRIGASEDSRAQIFDAVSLVLHVFGDSFAFAR